MPAKKIIIVRGIGENLTGAQLLADVVLRLRGFEVVYLDHAAQYGPVGGGLDGQAFMVTLLQGQALLRAELDKGPAVVAGYSAGAAIAGHVAAAGHPNLVAVALVADPFQPRGVISSAPDKFGVAGSRPIASNVSQGNGRVRWYFDPADVICQCPVNSPVRTLSDQTRWMSMTNPLQWVGKVEEDLRAKRFQAVLVQWWNPLAVIRQYQQAVVDVQGYLPVGLGGRGDHTGYARRVQSNGRTYTANAAEFLANACDLYAPQ